MTEGGREQDAERFHDPAVLIPALHKAIDEARSERDALRDREWAVAAALAEARPYVYNRTQGVDWRAQTAQDILGRVDAALRLTEEAA